MLEERGLKEREGGLMEFVRGVKVVGLREEMDGFLVTFDSGKSVWTRYIVGADGSKSIVCFSFSMRYR